MTRLRITVSWLMIIALVITVDFALLLLSRPAGNGSFVLVMPMADVLAVLLVATALRLRGRGEAPLSHVMFLLAGGMAMILFVYVFHLRPDVVYKYLLNIVERRGDEHFLVNALLHWLAVSASILIPALFAGWATRGYRLKLTTCIDGQSEVASRA
jgi:hypothetical protein